MTATRDFCAKLFAGSGGRFVSGACAGLAFRADHLRRWAARLDWSALSGNDQVAWTGELLAGFEDRLDWEVLSRNRGPWWTRELIEAHQDRWSWEDLSRNPALPWSDELLSRHHKRWTFTGATSLGRNPGLPWSRELIERNRDRWRFADLSMNPGISWTPPLIEAYQDEWAWPHLSANPALPWSRELLATFPDRWRWGRPGLSDNFGFPWTAEFLREHAESLDWHGLSNNPALPWTPELVEEFSGRWLWTGGGLSGNPGLPWSREFLRRWADRLTFDGARGVCDNTGVPWSLAILEDHQDRWDWRRLSRNPALPWGVELIERFHGRWHRPSLLGNRAVFPGTLLSAPEDFEAVYELVPDTPPPRGPTPKPVSKKVAQARGRSLRTVLGIKRVHASLQPWLQDAVRLDGPLVLKSFASATRRASSMDALFGSFGAKPFPAVHVGGDRSGVEFWLVPTAGAVISLDHHGSFFEIGQGIRAGSVTAFMKTFVEQGSRLSWEQLLALQAGAREREAAGVAPEQAFEGALLAATGWSQAELGKELGHPALEFARRRLGVS